MRFSGQTLPTHTEDLIQSFLIVKPALMKKTGTKINGIKIQWSLTKKSTLMERALRNLKAPNGSPAKSSRLISVTVGRLHQKPECLHRMSQE